MRRLTLGMAVLLTTAGACSREPAPKNAPPARKSCDASALRLTWPMLGRHGRNWVVTNYVDSDPSASLRDYTGAAGDLAKTYDGHAGVDINPPSFRAMDEGVTVLASAPGVVVEIEDGHFDRHTQWLEGAAWNMVALEHANGFRSRYGHLKKNSIVVVLGDPVAAGDPLGVVGSSGYSSMAHVHLEVRGIYTHAMEGTPRQSFVYGHRSPWLPQGARTVRVRIAGAIVWSHDFEVTAP
ncbi:MAG: M23 family metallopeptidase [Myxococcota bacterium]